MRAQADLGNFLRVAVQTVSTAAPVRESCGGQSDTASPTGRGRMNLRVVGSKGRRRRCFINIFFHKRREKAQKKSGEAVGREKKVL